MADKQLSGFEISQGEPLDIGAEACAQDLKRIISMIDEHLSQETYGDTYVRKRRISKRQATLMALDLDMSGLDGVADVETAAGSLDAKLHAIRTAVSEHCKTDTDDDVQSVFFTLDGACNGLLKESPSIFYDVVL